VKLNDYSQGSTTGEFLANQVSSIIENIGLKKFAAFVTDSGSNCRRAREIIEHNYPHILNIRCAAHAINLIASDFFKIPSVTAFISKLNKMIVFFKNSHAANKKLHDGLRNMKISRGSLRTYVITRWESLFDAVDSVLRARPVFDWVCKV